MGFAALPGLNSYVIDQGITELSHIKPTQSGGMSIEITSRQVGYLKSE
jgi:hypothetical protein